jgi:tRNA-2-methylthio-N6-dimethylallyladenosine synthase
MWINFLLSPRYSMTDISTYKRVYIETYGCQMNLADSELVGGILSAQGYGFTGDLGDADVVLINTCAIRDNAEQRIRGRLGLMNAQKRRNPHLVIGVLGCMAERLRERLIEEERLVDVIVGPDEYRKLPDLLNHAFEGGKGIAVRLSRVETYENIVPLRTEGISAWIAVMRGCDKFCTFCVVPFTRGRERSRPIPGVVEEVRDLAARGFKDITLLGQNVNSYRDNGHDFAVLLKAAAAVDRSVRIRFTTSHPQDMSESLIEAIGTTDNICTYIHLPVQSGSDAVLAAMNRTYTTDAYLRLVEKIRRFLPGVSLTTDIISGFPGETDADHRMTVALMQEVQYDGAYTFKYSPREHTRAWEMGDTVPEEVKGERVSEIVGIQQQISLGLNRRLIGSVQRVLVEGPSRKSEQELTGRTDTNKTVIFARGGEQPGEYVDVHIARTNSATLFGSRCAATDAAEDAA